MYQHSAAGDVLGLASAPQQIIAFDFAVTADEVIDEGDSGERVVIGLGLGESEVVVEVELVDWLAEGERVVDRFKVSGKSGYKPGMAETMGAGAAKLMKKFFVRQGWIED